MTEQQQNLPPKKKRASSFKRQRFAVLVGLVAVAVLVAALVPVLYFTTRTLFRDHDGTKYYIRRRDGAYVMEDADGNRLPTVTGGNYETASGTIVRVDESSGDYTIIAAVTTTGSETLQFNSGNEDYDILLYPYLTRADIRTIRVFNRAEDGTVADFTFVSRGDGSFSLTGSENAVLDDRMFASLVVLTGYTVTQMRLDLSDPDRAYGFAAHGYAEYGLPENPDDANVFYELTTTEGVTHKVIVGNLSPTGTGRYARYVGRNDVYLLRESADTEQSASMTTLLTSTPEAYISPEIFTDMTMSNYFDVTDFSLAAARLATGTDAPHYESIVTFSFRPVELRRRTFYASLPYVGTDLLGGYTINSLRADRCLSSLMDMTPLRTVWINRPGRPLDDMAFLNTYGVAFELSFTFNVTREGAEKNYAPKDYYTERIWISPLSEDNTYFLYTVGAATGEKMVIEVSRGNLEFLDWTAYDWVSTDFFTGNIGDCLEMEITSKRPTEFGKAGLTHLLLDFDNSASDQEVKDDNFTDSSGLQVYASYGDTVGETLDIKQFRYFYMTLLYTSIGGLASDPPTGLSEEQMEAYRRSGDEGADLVIRTRFVSGDEELTFVYRFYTYSAGRSFLTINGQGEFYVLSERIIKIVNDLGRIFDPSTPIDPRAKT